MGAWLVLAPKLRYSTHTHTQYQQREGERDYCLLYRVRDAVNQIDTVKVTVRQRKVYLGREREREIESRAIDTVEVHSCYRETEK